MYEVDSNYISDLTSVSVGNDGIDGILNSLTRSNPLSLENAARLLEAGSVSKEASLKITGHAGDLTREVFGRKIKLFVPLYLSNDCVNNCLYCAYRKGNEEMPRRTLSKDDFRREMEAVTDQGYRVIELVTSESEDLIAPGVLEDYIRIARETLDSVGVPGRGEDPEIILMSWVLGPDRFSTLKDAGLDAYYQWQETYNREQFRKLHPSGSPKANFEKRIGVFDHALRSGIGKIGMGVLFGLGKWKSEVLSLIGHGRYLEEKYGVSPAAVGIPRFKHAEGAPMLEAPYPVSDYELKLAVAIFRLAFPRSHVFLNTRERLNLMLELLDGGGSEMNIACAVYPGGYTEPSKGKQFDYFNYPTDKTLGMLSERGYTSSHFCPPE